MRAFRILTMLILAACTVSPAAPGRVMAQGGDQFLDGIGETGLVARYLFSGNAEDSSRNSFHATVRGTGGAFVEDPRFVRVLNLPGHGSHVQLPGNMLTGEDTLSVTGWLYLNADVAGQRLFDFGQRASVRFSAAVTDSFAPPFPPAQG